MRALIALVMTAALVVFGQASASADLFGLIKSDANPLTYASDEDTTSHHNWWNTFVTGELRDQYGARTDLTTTNQGRGLWNDSTDVVWFVSPDVASNDLADETCRKVNGSVCDRARVRFKQSLTTTVPNLTGFVLVCHEFGHALGFEHKIDGGCMGSPINAQSPGVTGTLNSHMIGHINAQY